MFAMMVRVKEAPDPILVPSDVPGAHAGDDAAIAAMIEAATEELDGPTGLLQRAIGPQTIQATFDRALLGWCEWNEFSLPLPPLISVVSVTAIDSLGGRTTLPTSAYRVRGVGTDEGGVALTDGWPDAADQVEIVYRAGYDGDVNGRIPARVKSAVVLAVANMQSMSRDNLHLRAEEFEGIGRQEFSVSESGSRVMRQAMTSLIAGLRVFR